MMEARFERQHVPVLDALGKPIVENGVTKMEEKHIVSVVVSRNSQIEMSVEHFFFNLEADARTLRTEKSDKTVEFFRDQYERWKKGLAPKIDGIPIEDWPYLTSGQITQFKQLGLHTVEQVADPTEDVCNKIVSGRDIQRRAKAFIDNIRGPEAMARQMMDLRAELKALREENTEIRKKSEAVATEIITQKPDKRDIIVGMSKGA